jgi:hypothetical protein
VGKLKAGAAVVECESGFIGVVWEVEVGVMHVGEVVLIGGSEGSCSRRQGKGHGCASERERLESILLRMRTQCTG